MLPGRIEDSAFLAAPDQDCWGFAGGGVDGLLAVLGAASLERREARDQGSGATVRRGACAGDQWLPTGLAGVLDRVNSLAALGA